MLEFSTIHFFNLFNKQYKCIYSKRVLDGVSPAHTGLGIAVPLHGKSGPKEVFNVIKK